MPHPPRSRRSIDLTAYHCPNPKCRDRLRERQNLVARGTYQTKAGEVRRLITCRTCGRTFSSHPSRQPPRRVGENTINYAIFLLTKGIPISLVARLVHTNPNIISASLRRIAHDFRSFLDIQAKEPAINGKELELLFEYVRNNQLRQRAMEWRRRNRQDPTFTKEIRIQISLAQLAVRRPRLRSRLHR